MNKCSTDTHYAKIRTSNRLELTLLSADEILIDFCLSDWHWGQEVYLSNDPQADDNVSMDVNGER